MIGSVKTELLKHLVVRVDSPDGKILGSGFYAAPGWVLTAAHVADGLSRVRLTPATGGEPIDAEVVARSDTREAEAPSGFWPFPDLAIIRFDQAREHPSAFVEAASPEGDSTCTAWGYARREKGQDPVGSPAKFEFVGFEGDGWLSLKSDAVRHGMSGAPLVCPARRAVVGVMSVTRDPDSSLGGWASPIEALTGALPGVPEALVVEGRKLLEASRAEAVRHRMAWHGVIPIQDAENVLERSWGTYRGGGHPDPADLLLAEYRVVPYLFRDDDLNTLEAWCQAPEPIKVGLAAGVGGGGKTRLAVELCHRMVETHGWVVVGEISRFGEGGQRGLSDIYTSLRQISLPRLIVLDYAEDRVPSEVAALIGQLRSGATDVAPVRLMLLTRDAERPRHVSLIDSIKDDATVSVKQIIQDLERSDAAEKGLSLDERNRLYRCAVERFASAWGAEPPDGSPALSSPDQAEPLGVLFTALDAVLSSSEAAGMGVGSSWGRDPAERILRHEEKCWRMGAPDETADVLRRCIAVATLAGARDAAEADQLLECLPELARDENRGRRRSLIGWLSRLYKGVGVLNPLRPDRLGEALVIHTLVDEPDDEVIETILRSGSPSQCARTVTVLTRCSARAGLARQVLVALLSKLHMHLTLKAEVCAHGSRDREGDYTLASALVTALNGGLSEDLTRREPDNTGYQRDVSVSLVRLGDLAVAVGDSTGAKDLFTRSLTIAEDLTRREPDNTGYQRDVSVSLVRLGDLAVAVGDSTGAKDLFTRSLTIREDLTRREPDNTGYQRDVSVSLVRLGDLAVAVGDSTGAKDLFTRSLTIAEDLTRREPDNTGYQRDVSVSLNRLGDLAVAVGDSTGAKDLFTRSLTIAEDLTRREPDNTGYQRDVSVSLVRLGDLAVAVGDSPGAKDLFTRSLTIREDLTRREPDNTGYQRDVSVSLNRLGDLAVAVGDSPGAKDLFTRSLTIREDLTRREPDRSDRAEDLALSHYFLCKVDQPNANLHRQAVQQVLDPFEKAGALSRQGERLMAWARNDSPP